MVRCRFVYPLLEPPIGHRQCEVADHLIVGQLVAAALGEPPVAVGLAVVERQRGSGHHQSPAVTPDNLLQPRGEGPADPAPAH